MTNKKLDFCHRVYMEIRSVTSAFQSYMDPLFSEVGLKPLEGCVLAELNHKDGQTINELSCSTNITSTNLPPLWHALEEKGLIERRRDEIDARSYRLFLTDSGRETLSKLDQMIGSAAESENAEIDALRSRTIDGFAACRELMAYRSVPSHDVKNAHRNSHQKEDAAQ